MLLGTIGRHTFVYGAFEMAERPLKQLVQRIRRLARSVDPPAPDTLLLQRFVADGDENAFTDLVVRHGPLVSSVCRNVLRNEHDAEDAFQATFLVLAKKAGSIRKPGSLASWLHGIAFRLANKSRSSLASRRMQSLPPEAGPMTLPDDELTWHEVQAVLHEELARLPEKYRAPLMLCYFEGLTQDEAAHRMAIKPRTIKARIATGRERLRGRLTRRGLTLPAALAVPLLLPNTGSAAVASTLVESTVRAARGFAAGDIITGLVSARTVTLAHGAIHQMAITQSACVTGIILAAIAVFGSSAAILSSGTDIAPAEQSQVAGELKTQPQDELRGQPLPAGATARLGTTRFRLNGTGFRRLGMGFLPDNNTLLTASPSVTSVQFWDAGTGRLLREVSTDPISISGFAVSNDGKLLAVAGSTDRPANGPRTGAIRVIETASGKAIWTFPRTSQDVDECNLAFTPDNKLLMSLAKSGMLRIEEIASGTEILNHAFPRDVENAFTLSPDGSLIALASGPNTRKVFLWKWQSGEEPKEIMLGSRVACLGFSHNGALLAARDDLGGPIFLWDVAKNKIASTLSTTELSGSSGQPVFSPDSKHLIMPDHGNNSMRRGGRLDLWSLATGKIDHEFNIPGESVLTAAASNDGRWLAAGCAHRVHVWDLQKGREIGDDDAGHCAGITDIAITNDLIATASDDSYVRLWNPSSGRELQKLQHGNWVRGVALSADGALVASSSLDETVRLWDARTGREIYSLVGHGKTGGTRKLAFTPDARQLMSWGDDYYLRVWDVKTGKAIVEHDLRPDELKQAPAAGARLQMRLLMPGKAVFAPDGSRFVLSSAGKCRIYDMKSGKELLSIDDPDSGLSNSAAISPDSKYLLTSSWAKPVQTKEPDGRTGSSVREHIVAVWDLSTGKRIHQLVLPEPSSAPAAFTPDGKQFVAITEKPSCKMSFYDLTGGKEVRTIEGIPDRISALGFSPDGKRLVAA